MSLLGDYAYETDDGLPYKCAVRRDFAEALLMLPGDDIIHLPPVWLLQRLIIFSYGDPAFARTPLDRTYVQVVIDSPLHFTALVVGGTIDFGGRRWTVREKRDERILIH